MKILPPVSIEARRLLPSRWDLLAAVLVLAFIVAFADTSRLLIQPLSVVSDSQMSLDPALLPGYALRTGLRMLLAMLVSLAFTFSYATWAAKNPRAGNLLVPLLDILQSLPILGFLSVTVVWFLSLSPGRVFGAELACVFTIFTSQAWNMAFSFYQSLRTVPEDLTEAGRMLGLSAWARFWRIEAPFATPPLIWNMMVSMAGGWFFVTVSEAISVGKTSIALPGIGSWILLSSALFCIGLAGVMLRRNPLVILLSLEIMLNAGNLLLVAGSRYVGGNDGHVLALTVMAVAAAEVVVGLGLIVALARRGSALDVDELRSLHG